MNRKNKVLTVLMIVVLSTSLVNYVYAEQLVYDELLVFGKRLNVGIGDYFTFYSNYTNLFYAFFGDVKTGIPAFNFVQMYCTSYDGITWTNKTRQPTNEAIGAIEHYSESRNDFYLHINGSKLWFVNMNDQDGRPYEIDYRVYDLELNGSLTVIIEELDIDVTLLGGYTPESALSIVVDNETRPYIAFESIDVGLTMNDCMLFRGSYTNGSWISWTERTSFLTEIGSAVDELFYCDLLNTGDLVTQTGIGRGVNWIVHWDATNGIPEALDTDSLVNYYDGTGFTHSGLSALGMEDNEAQWDRRTISMASVGNITVIVVQIEDLVTPDRKRLDLAVREGKNAWQNRTAVSFEIAGDVKGDGQFKCAISLDNDTDAIIVWWLEDPDDNRTMWYRRCNIRDNMDNPVWVWQTPITEWQTVSATDPFTNWWHAGGYYGYLPYNVPMSIVWLDLWDDQVWHDYIFSESNGELDFPFEYYNTTLTSGIEFDDWVFMGETYYFTSYVKGADTFNLTFNDGYDIHTINFNFDNSTYILSTDNNEDHEFVTGLFYSDYELIGDVQRLVWGWIPEKNIVDDLNVTVSYELYNEDANFTLTGDTGIIFNLYNIGGFGEYQHTNRGRTGRKVAGDQFEIWNNGFFAIGVSDEINATGIWRRLQHIHTTFSFYRQRPYVAGYYPTIISDDDRIYFGIDYYENGSWTNVLEVRITIEIAGLVGRGGIGADSSYDVLNVTWWTQGVMEKQDIITVYNHGYSFHGDEPNNRTYNRLWLDLWFNKLNSSTVVGGRIAPFYNGMYEWNGNPFWFGYGDFAPFYYNNSATSSIYYTELKNSTGNVRSCYGLEVMRFYDGIRKTDDFLGYLWQIQDFQIFDVNLADDRMEGIDTPIFVEAEDISMPKGGSFLQPLVNAINGIATMFTKAIFNGAKLIMGSIGIFMEMIGLGEWWNTLSINISRIADFSLELFEDLQDALINSALLLTQISNLLYNGIGRFVYVITNFITSLLAWYQGIIDLFSGGGIFNLDIWASLSLGDWFYLFVHLLPIWWLQRLGKADDLISTLQGDITFVIGVIVGVFNFLVGIIMLSIAILNFILGLLPI